MRVSVHECVCVCEYDYAVMELKCVGSVRCVCARAHICWGERSYSVLSALSFGKQILILFSVLKL